MNYRPITFFSLIAIKLKRRLVDLAIKLKKFSLIAIKILAIKLEIMFFTIYAI
jgi:hypothetical protein